MAQDEAVKAAAKLCVIGGSAGSLQVLLRILPALKTSDCCAVIIVLHRPAEDEGQLTALLDLKTNWQVKEAEDKDSILPNIIYLAPGGYHLLVEKDRTLALDSSEKINYSRPSIDPTFETAAEAFGPDLRCLLISGANADGVKGLMVAAAHRAVIAIQDPAEAQVGFMPASALRMLPDSLVLSTAQMADYVSG